MSYERDEALRQQEALEEMIRMRQPYQRPELYDSRNPNVLYRQMESDAQREGLAERAKDYQDLAALAHIRMVRAMARGDTYTTLHEQTWAEQYARQARTYLIQLLELPK